MCLCNTAALSFYKFYFLKGAYAGKLIQIVFSLYQVFLDRAPQEIQCNDWLNSHGKDFQRDTSETSGARPLTMTFFCNFNRVHADNSKRDTSSTIKYYNFNYTIQNVLLTIEIVYCLLCMLLYLLIIYWVQEGK